MSEEQPRPQTRPPWSSFRAALSAAGFHPSRRLGQNFLLDEGMVAAIAREAELEPGQAVLEVGVGCGFLSAHLLSGGADLLGVEIDSRLAEVARGFLEPLAARVGAPFELLECDALAGKHQLQPALVEHLDAGPTRRVVANLPYAAGSPLMVLLSRRPEPPPSITVLVQLEVAERISARPGQSAWGALGARLAAVYRARIARRVPPQLFWPRPKVESALLVLERHERWPSVGELAAMDELVHVLFQARRKTLRRALARRCGGPAPAEVLLLEQGLDPTCRADSLDVKELLQLALALPDETPGP